MNFHAFRKAFYRFEDLVKKPVKLPPKEEREEAKLPEEAKAITVETALNSRCTSDYDNNPRKFHWGMFDPEKKLSEIQIEEIIALSKIPRFGDQKLAITRDQNILTFLINSDGVEELKNCLMVESGMQQQAIGLVCAAFGVGMVFNAMGENGAKISRSVYATVKTKIDAMKPSYDGLFWTQTPPDGIKRTNLPEPDRKGVHSLISVLKQAAVKKDEGKNASLESISQLLWAARGRTPHYYKSIPWGMTIPAYRGEQKISSLFLIRSKKLERYVNWIKNSPAHSLEKLDEMNSNSYAKILRNFAPYNCFIVFNKNENYFRAFWETGYQLLNLILQAQTLDLSFKGVLFDFDKGARRIFQDLGISDPVCGILLQYGV